MKNRLIELIQDQYGKLSSNRVISFLFALTACFIAIFLCIHGIVIGEYNVLCGLLISGAVGNKIAGDIKTVNLNKSVEITSNNKDETK